MKRRVLRYGGIGSLLVVLLFIFVFITTQDSWSVNSRYFFQLLNAPQSVKNAIFITTHGEETALARVAFGGIVTTVYPERNILEVARTNGVMVGVLEDAQSGAVDVFLIQGKKLTPLTTDGLPKSSITISPDGSRVAFAVKGPAFEGIREDAYDVRRYEISVLRISSPDVVGVYKGNHPRFFDRDSLFAFSEQGLTVYELQTGSSRFFADSLAFTASERPVFGEGGPFMVRDPFGGSQFLVMNMVSLNPIFYQLVGTLSTSNEQDFFTTQGNTVFKGSFVDGVFQLSDYANLEEDPEVVLSLPEEYFKPITVIF